MFDTTVPENLEDIPPGAELGLVLTSLDWDRLSDYDLVRALKAQARQVSHYQAGMAWTINKVTERYQQRCRPEAFAHSDATKGATAEIGAALTLTRRASELETGFSVELLRHRPQVFEALLFGRIDLRRAKVLVDGTLHVTDTIAHAALEELLPEAPGLTSSQLKHRLAKLVVDADPQAAQQRYDQSLENRRIEVHPNDTGTADIIAWNIAPHIAMSINRWIHKEALKLKRLGDERTIDQIRADIFTDLLRRRHHGKKVTRADYGNLDIRGTAESFAGISNESADLNGFGPVLADIARQIAEHHDNTRLRWTLIDPDTGEPIDGGTTRRRPTTSQRRRAETLHPTCIHPGCRMPSVDCDIDHRKPWAHYRITCTCDLAPMCRHHHTVRHTFGWTYQPTTGGDHRFTSPFGHRYTTSGQPAARSP
jgi:hypothetical protein